MLLQEHSSCLCRGENGKPFCLAELWPALIVRIHWDFTINAVHAFQNTKKNYFGFTHAPLKFISAPRKDKHFIGQLWQLMTASNVVAWTQAWQSKWAVFKIEGFVCKRFLPFFPTPSPFFYLRHFSRGLWLLFLVPCSKPHRNACYGGYSLDPNIYWIYRDSTNFPLTRTVFRFSSEFE